MIGAAQFMSVGPSLIQKSLEFRHKDLAINKHEAIGIDESINIYPPLLDFAGHLLPKATLVDLLEKGVLTRDPRNRIYRIAIEIVGFMIKAML
jgi:hypothetical protein